MKLGPGWHFLRKEQKAQEESLLRETMAPLHVQITRSDGGRISNVYRSPGKAIEETRSIILAHVLAGLPEEPATKGRSESKGAKKELPQVEDILGLYSEHYDGEPGEGAG